MEALIDIPPGSVINLSVRFKDAEDQDHVFQITTTAMLLAISTGESMTYLSGGNSDEAVLVGIGMIRCMKESGFWRAMEEKVMASKMNKVLAAIQSHLSGGCGDSECPNCGGETAAD